MTENGTPDPNVPGAQPPQPATPPPAPQPQAPPAAQYAPPPQQPVAGAAQQGQPAPAKKGRRTLIIIAVVAVILMLLLCCCTVVGYTMYSGEATTQEQIDTVVLHVGNASTAAIEVQTLWTGWDAGASSDTSPPVAASETLIEDMRAELALASEAAEELRDSTFKTEALAAITEMEKALAVYEDLLAGIGDFWVVVDSVGDMSEEFAAANDKLNDAVTAMNQDKYAEGKKLAQEAKATFDKLAGEYASVAAANPELETDKLAAIASKSSAQAAHVIKQGDLGPKNSVTAYNKEVEAYNDLSSEIAGMPLPGWFEDPTLITAEFDNRLEEAQGYFDAAAEAADRADTAAAAGDY